MKGKYALLYQFLARRPVDTAELQMTFDGVEGILGFGLPDSAVTWGQWWENSYAHTQARSWLEAGWRVRWSNPSKREVAFTRMDDAELCQRDKQMASREGRRPVGRPPLPLPELIPDTPENVARIVLNSKAKRKT